MNKEQKDKVLEKLTEAKEALQSAINANSYEHVIFVDVIDYVDSFLLKEIEEKLLKNKHKKVLKKVEEVRDKLKQIIEHFENTRDCATIIFYTFSMLSDIEKIEQESNIKN